MKKTILLFSILIVGCNAIKKVEYKTGFNKLSTKTLIGEIENRTPDYDFITYRSQATVKQKNSTNQFNIGIRIEKNEKILITGSLLIPLFKALFTREQISFYEKISKTYYKDEYSPFSRLFDQELTLKMFQNLITGFPLIKFEENKWKQVANNQIYSLQSLSNRKNLTIIYGFSPTTFRLVSQTINFNDNRLIVNYGKYIITNGELFPTKITIFLSLDGEKLEVILNLKVNKLGGPVSFPFQIPNDYKPIKL